LLPFETLLLQLMLSLAALLLLLLLLLLQLHLLLFDCYFCILVLFPNLFAIVALAVTACCIATAVGNPL